MGRFVIGFVFVAVTICGSLRAATPVRVFVLAGQSNMEGHGVVAADPKRNGGLGSLEHLARDPQSAARYRHLLGAAGGWLERDDVLVTFLGRGGGLRPGFGVNEGMIGPELGFGTVVGNALDEPVLLVKCAWGGKSLAIDFRPPSAGLVPYELGGKAQEALAGNPEMVGFFYRETIRLAREALETFPERYPALATRGCVLAGFGWHQGWNDRVNERFTAEYEANLVHLIHDVRKDLGMAKLPVVVAETGMGGMTEKHPRALALMQAQAAAVARPEFARNAAFVGTRTFWREKEVSPLNQSYHWNGSAETYYLIGEGMGRAMLGLLGNPKPAKR